MEIPNDTFISIFPVEPYVYEHGFYSHFIAALNYSYPNNEGVYLKRFELSLNNNELIMDNVYPVEDDMFVEILENSDVEKIMYLGIDDYIRNILMKCDEFEDEEFSIRINIFMIEFVIGFFEDMISDYPKDEIELN